MTGSCKKGGSFAFLVSKKQLPPPVQAGMQAGRRAGVQVVRWSWVQVVWWLVVRLVLGAAVGDLGFVLVLFVVVLLLLILLLLIWVMAK